MDSIVPLIIGVVYLAIVLATIAGVWKSFAKAGQPGWAALVPFYNTYVLLQIAGRPGWWLILLFVPLVGLVVAIITLLDLAKKFGKGAGFGLGLCFLPFVFWPLLGFGDAKYEG